jgi:hypothetical protein
MGAPLAFAAASRTSTFRTLAESDIDSDLALPYATAMRKPLSSAFLLSLVACAATAAPLHWQLNGVVFSDGGRAFGGFDYDAVTGTYSNIDLTTTPGSASSSGSYYNSAAPYSGSTAAGYFNGVSTVPVFPGSTAALALGFSPALSAAGGTVSIVAFAAESICANSACGSVTPQRTITSGTATAISTSAPQRWFFGGVVLSDGAQVFGSFVFDANTGTYSSISITTTGGSAMSGTTYFTQNPSAGSSAIVSAVSAASIVSGTTTFFSASFASALTNAGGTVNITSVSEGICTSANCATSGTLRTAVVAGTVSTTSVTDDTKVLPQVADGGGFITTLIFTNPTGAPISTRITFWQDNGSLWLVSLNGSTAASGYTVVVPGHSSVFLSTPGIGPSVAGWMLATNVAKLGVAAAFRLQLPGIPESEATVVGFDPTSGFGMPFDETTGFDTGFGIANVSATDTVIEYVYFYDSTGKLIYSDSSHLLTPHQHESFFFSTRYGSTPIMGQRGEVRVYYGVQGTPTAPILGLSGMGLRVNPGGTFTSLQTFTANVQ